MLTELILCFSFALANPVETSFSVEKVKTEFHAQLLEITEFLQIYIKEDLPVYQRIDVLSTEVYKAKRILYYLEYDTKVKRVG